MNYRILPTMVIAVAVALSISGCPGGSTGVTTGLWLFTIVSPGVSSTTGALNVLPTGQTVIPSPTPPEAANDFGTPPIWTLSGSTINFQFAGVASRYIGTVHSSTSMSGTVEESGNILGLWSAILLEQ